MIDTPGYGDSMDLESWRKNIQNYLKDQLVNYEKERQMIEEMRAERLDKIRRINNIADSRVHLLLFFFSGHHTNFGDFTMLKKLQIYVNIIPVIAKADSFKENELHQMKMDISSTAEDRRVNFFDCIEAIKTYAGNNKA